MMQHFRVGIDLKQIMTPTTSRARKTKIICAIGPASWSEEMLGERDTASWFWCDGRGN
jgi:hypothetical protein